ncbi:MAG: hypothetical protein NZ455_04965 [Bacteroidia bacterium]|nr:hypothetical protein [Bacteroidia bacterium]MDW8345748.1 hypothetical protein [Bacteroidia bacterium]
MTNFKEEQHFIIHIIEYIKKYLLATKQDIKVDILKIAGTVIITIVLFCVGMTFMAVFTVFMGFLLEWWLESLMLSFAILSVLYAILGIVIYSYRAKLKAKIIQRIIKQIET